LGSEINKKEIKMIRKIFQTAFLAILVGVFGCNIFSPDSKQLLLKSPPPPFVAGSSRNQAQDTIKAAFTESGIKYGNKMLRWSPGSPMALTLAEEKLAIFECRAKTVPSVWAPCNQFKLSIDKKDKTMTGVSSFSVGKGGPLGEFTQKTTLISDQEVAIELSHACPEGTEKRFKSFLCSITIPKHMAAGKNMVVNDKTVTFPKVTEWGSNPKLRDHMRHVRSCKSIIFSPKSSDEGFSLSFSSTPNVNVSVFRSLNSVHLYFGGEMSKKLRGKLKMVLDFKTAKAVGKSGDCILAGINFTQCDDLDVPVFNKNGNLLMNPSFESGVRYFQNEKGELLTGDSRSGRHAFKLTHLTSMAVPIQPNTPYMLSFYAKVNDKKKNRITTRVSTFGVWRKSQKYFSTPFRKHFYLKKTGEWERFSFPISCKNSVIKFSLKGQGALIDDIQLERAPKETPYSGNKFGVELLTDMTPDGLNDASKPLDASLRLNGPKGKKGVANVEVSDFFNRKLLAMSIPFKIGPDGQFDTKLPLEPNLERGVFLVKCRIVPDKLPTFTDYLRITRVKTPTFPRKHKILQGLEYVNAFGRAPIKDNTRFAFLRDCGIGGVVWNRYPLDQETLKRLEKYKLDVRYLNINSTNLYNKKNWSTQDLWKVTPNIKTHIKVKNGKVTKEVLENLEKLGYKTIHDNPWINPFEIGNELSFTKDEMYDDYAKMALAMIRGAKRANPNIKVLPASPCNMQNKGITEVEKILKACKRVDPSFKFDLVGIHTYRPFPEQSDFEGDLQKFLAMLKKQGYDKTPIFMKEGLYFYPLNVPAWKGISPWQATTVKDKYAHLKTPTYDIGWAERVSAAMRLRQWLACYKYRDRIERAVTWGPIQLNSHTPYAWVCMSNALTDILGDADFKKEVRPARGTRAYIFEDAEQRPVAAVSYWTEALDRGKGKPPELLVDFDGVTPEFIDMLGNPRNALHKDNRYQLPISNYPFYIRAEAGELEALKKALSNAALSNSQVPLVFSTSLKNQQIAEVNVINPLTKSFKGQISVANAPLQDCVIKPLEKKSETVKLKQAISFNKIIDYTLPIKVKIPKIKDVLKDESTFRAFAVKHIAPNKIKIDAETADWTDLPAIPMPNRMDAWCRPENRKWLGPDDFSATFKMAWNEKALYLLVEVVDDKFIMVHKKKKPAGWYNNDTIQLFFDTLGDGPAKGKTKNYGFDTNDYSYELLPTGVNSAIAYRRFTVDHQYTGGVGYELLADSVEPGVKTAFRRVDNRLIYEVMFPARYLQPMELKAGNAPGFGMMIFDRDLTKDISKQILMTTPIGCFRRPDVYPMMLFSKGK
jgi:cellulose/xylan binding protein with CBM9 domain